MSDLNSVVGGAGGPPSAPTAAAARPDIARLMQLHAQAQAGQAASLASLVNGPGGLPGLPPGALAQSLGLPHGLQGLPPGLNIPTSLSSSLLQSLPTSIAASLGGLGPNPLHPALSMLKPQLPTEPKREEDVRKSLSESNASLVSQQSSEDRHRASLSPGEQAARERALNNRAHSPEHKKLKRSLNNNEEASDGEKSDADLVVD